MQQFPQRALWAKLSQTDFPVITAAERNPCGVFYFIDKSSFVNLYLMDGGGKMEKVLKIAHRSGPTVYPEQTVASALNAMKCGADMVEIDLRRLGDGGIAVCHDDNTGRVFGVNRLVSDMTTREFTSLTHKDFPAFHGHTPADYTDAGVFPLLLHIKEGGDNIPAYIDFFESHDYAGKYVMGVARSWDVERIKQINPRIPVLAFIKNVSFIEDNIAAGADFVRLWEGWLTRESVELIRSHGKKLWVMSGYTEGREVGEVTDESLAKIMSFSPDGILINDVEKMK